VARRDSHSRNQPSKGKSSMTKKKKPVVEKVSKVTIPQVLSGEQLAAGIEKIGLSQEGFGRFIGVGGRTVRSWVSEQFPIPGAVAYLIKLMVKTKTTAEELE
jgi:DNA-binding transcriptional regulator YiaG